MKVGSEGNGNKKESALIKSGTRNVKKTGGEPKSVVQKSSSEVGPVKKKSRRSAKVKRRRIYTGTIAAILSLIIVVGLYLTLSAHQAIEEGGLSDAIDDETGLPSQLFDPDREVSDKARRDGVYNILVGGTDKDGYRTDAMLLVNYDSQSAKINIMQIPRDTYIDIGKASKKANALYAYGKGPLMAQELSKAFGVPIDYYVVINLSTFRTIVDLVDGVQMDVPHSIDYEDSHQDLYIHIKKGVQTLNGEQAEQLVRYRMGYVTGDIGRMEIQKKFLAAFAKKILSASTITKIPSIIDTVFKNMKTNMDLATMLSFAASATSLKLENIRIWNMPGEWRGSKSAYGAYREELLYIIENYFSPFEEGEGIDEAEIEEIGRSNPPYEFKLDGSSLVEVDENPADVSMLKNPNTGTMNKGGEGESADPDVKTDPDEGSGTASDGGDDETSDGKADTDDGAEDAKSDADDDKVDSGDKNPVDDKVDTDDGKLVILVKYCGERSSIEGILSGLKSAGFTVKESKLSVSFEATRLVIHDLGADLSQIDGVISSYQFEADDSVKDAAATLYIGTDYKG